MGLAETTAGAGAGMGAGAGVADAEGCDVGLAPDVDSWGGCPSGAALPD